MIQLLSFGYKSGVPDADIVIDVRGLRNPYRDPELRRLDGLDPLIQRFVADDPLFTQSIAQIETAVDQGHQRIAIGCHGGHHRSVAVVELARVRLDDLGLPVEALHTSSRVGQC